MPADGAAAAAGGDDAAGISDAAVADATGIDAATIDAARIDAATIGAAVRALRAGEPIGLPTETVYGLAADASSAPAVAAIYRIKGRPPGHPLIVHVHDVAQARRWGSFDARAERLAAAFWPGPLTMILPRRPQAPHWACGGHDTIGLRCPSHPVAQAVLRAAARAGIDGLAAPSANRFGHVSPTSARHVRDDLGDAVGVVLDAGPSAIGVESTIVDLSRADAVWLRRPGRIAIDALQDVLGAPLQRGSPDGAASVSGELASHYAPRAALSLLERDALLDALHAARAAGRPASAWLRAPLPVEQPPYAAAGTPQPSPVAPGTPQPSPVAPDAPQPSYAADESPPATPSAEPGPDRGLVVLPMPDDPRDVERELYATLRRLDRDDGAPIWVQAPPAGPGWDAVRDRLARAAAR